MTTRMLIIRDTLIIIGVVILVMLLVAYVTVSLISDVDVSRLVNFFLGMAVGYVAMLVWLVRVEIIRHG